ncbi:hypothetical protein ACXET9_11075 [Brachybacterium sp. DNPG3]
MVKYVVILVVLALLLLRLLRGRWGAKLLGISERVLDIIYIAALLVTGVIAGLTEYWALLAAVGALLVWRIAEEVIARGRRRSAAPRS